MLNKRLINTGAAAAFDPLQNFETVTYTGNSGTQKITGYIRKGAAFNGSSSISTNLNLDTSSAFTWSCWISISNKRSTNYISEILTTTLASSPFNGLTLAIDSPNLALMAGGSNQGTILSNPNLNQWYHIAITYNGAGTIKCYVDNGTPVTISYTLAQGGTLGIGDGPVGSWLGFIGKIDQVRIFDKELSSAEVTTLYNEDYDSSTKSTTDIFGDGSGVALYELDEDANDSSGTSTVPTHYFFVSDAGNQSSSVRVNSVDSEFTYTRPSGYDEWGGTFDPNNVAHQYVGSSSYTTLSEGNKKWDKSGAYYNSIWSTNGYNSGKYYFELEFLGAELFFGIIKTSTATTLYDGNVVKENSISYGSWNTTSFKYSITNSSEGQALSTNDVIGFAVDFDNLELKYYRNNTLIDTSTIASSNYNGTPTNVNFLGMAFQPDLVWIKRRNTAEDHALFDSVRGTLNQISSNLTAAAYDTSSPYEGVTSFDSNGFTTGNNGATNRSPNTYVAWCWKAGGAAVSNTDGSITSQVSANPDAGFSIVKAQGTGAYPTVNTVGHGLNQAPEMIITKDIDQTLGWLVYHTALTDNTGYLRLDATNAESTDSNVWGNQEPTSSIFGIANGWTINLNSNFIAYCFHSVDGYQKVGSYTGNRPTDVSVNVGFAPRFVMIKCVASGESWVIVDSARGDNLLHPDTSGAEQAYTGVSLTSTGFTVHDSGLSNTDNATHIYLAIA